MENALKHNTATIGEPLLVSVHIEEDLLVVSNNLQPKSFPEPGAGIGLVNLNERFRILSGKDIEIKRTGQEFTVKLPLQ